jgi:hypothetical protein
MITQIIAKLKSTSKTNDKKAILLANADNMTLKHLFQLTYDKKFNFWIKASMPTTFGTEKITAELLTDIQDHLHGRAITGNAARAYLMKVLESLTEEDAQVIVNMINRDLDCKTSIALTNETWPGAIPEFPVMLADKCNEKTLVPFYAAEPTDMIKLGIPNLCVQRKEDGGRFQYAAGLAGFSRNGSELMLHGVFSFLDDIFDGFVIDGELITIDSATGKFDDRKTSNGIYNKAVRGTISKEEAERFHYIVWDLIPLKEFWEGKGTEEYRYRLARLETTLQKYQSQFGHKISLVPSKIIHHVNDAYKFYDEMLSIGAEGAMLKLLDSKWENKRSKSVIKLKEEKDATLLCIGVTPHAKKSGQIGSLECETACGKLQVSIGSGLTDDDRIQDPEYYIGKLIDLKYNALIKSKNRDTWSMFLPIYRGIRIDVNEADTLEKLK